MFVLPTALAALRAYRQFIVFQLVPDPARPGKTNKFPIDWRGGQRHDAHDPAIWLDAETAAGCAVALGDDYSVGFVFTEADDLWFIDVDECLEDGAWSPTAQALMARFAGAAWEISASGRGLHGIGRGRAPTPRKIKYGQWFDLYTEARFVALTGTAIVGDANTDHTPALAQLVVEYLTRDPNEVQADWTTEAAPEWRGPADDAELIRRASKSQSAAQAFGNKAAFKDLFERNVEVLAKCYPPDGNSKSGAPYNQSSADSALAQSLAFWTGRNCERIERVMRLSALLRDKWNDGGYYLNRTITLCCGRQYDVLNDKPKELPATTQAAAGAPTATMVTGETFLTAVEQTDVFKGCVYVTAPHRALVPGGHLLKPDQFKVIFGGFSFPMDPTNERVVRNAWEAFTESQSYRSPRADGLCFRPELPPGALINDAGMILANVWWPIDTPCVAGDAGPYVRHLQKLFPVASDLEIITSYMAAVVQHPGVKFQWAPMIQGMPGNGKTLLLRALTFCVGERYTHLPNTEDLVAGGAKFTGWLQNKLLIGLEEIYTGDRRNMMDALKPLITNTRVEIQAKGQDQFTGDNRANFIAFSNHKDAVPKTDDERRWAVFFSGQQSVEDLKRDGMGGDYMPNLWAWLRADGFAIVNNYLRSYAIPDELNPAGACHRAPQTSSTDEAILLSVGAIEQEILEAVGQGLPGFAGGWISSMAVDRLLVRLNAERRIPPRKRRDLLANLGYEWHPALPEGRVHNSVQPDNGKTRLFVKRGSLLRHLAEPRMVTKKYTEDQNAAAQNRAIDGSVNTV